MDVYEPTKFVLDNLFSKIVKGGIILIDDYQTVYGATKAIKEFLKKNKKLKIQKLRFNSVPWFIIKKYSSQKKIFNFHIFLLFFRFFYDSAEQEHHYW